MTTGGWDKLTALISVMLNLIAPLYNLKKSWRSLTMQFIISCLYTFFSKP